MTTKVNAAIYAGILDGNSPALRKRFFSIGGGGGKSKQQSESKSETVFKDDFLTKLFKAFPMPNYSENADTASTKMIAPPVEGEPGFSGIGALSDQQQVTLPLPKFRGLDDKDFGGFHGTQFRGLENMDFDKLEGNLNRGLDQKLSPVYERERARNREELGQSGLLTSPVAYARGGALENLQNSYMDARAKGATDIGIETTRLKQGELARQTGFEQEEQARRTGHGMEIMKTKQQELARKTGFDFDMITTFNEIYDRLADVILRAGGTSTSRSSGSSSNAQARFSFLGG
jgi:hypothetical protein